MIINLTQHEATEDQLNAGVVEPEDKQAIRSLLTFPDLPARHNLIEHAQMLAEICHEHGAKQAMIGGAPFFMPVLDRVLREHDIHPVYAFSKRECVEETHADGSVTKHNVFRHLGFVV